MSFQPNGQSKRPYCLQSIKSQKGQVEISIFKNPSMVGRTKSTSTLSVMRRRANDNIEVFTHQLTPQFGNPIRDAAKNLRISVRELRRRCHLIGVIRWPYKTKNIEFRKSGLKYDFNCKNVDQSSPAVKPVPLVNECTETLRPPPQAEKISLPSFDELMQSIKQNRV